MADEPTQDLTTPVDPATLPVKQDGVGVSPQTVAALAKIVPDETLRLFDADLRQAIANAKADVNRTQAALAVAAAPATGAGAIMDAEQSAEWLRCALGHMHGRMIPPREGLDADGLITQALNPVTGASGGYLMPEAFVAEVEKKALEPVVIWPLLTHRKTKSRTVKKPEVTAYPSVNKGTAAKVNSATTSDEIAETVPTFDELEWNLEDFDARMPIKLDLIEESPIDVYQELVALVADAYSIEHEREPLTGTGHANKRPLGIMDAATGITTIAIGAVPTVAVLLDFCAQIPLRYRRQAKLAMGSQTIYAVVAQLAANVNAAEFLLGRIPPMVESEHVEEGKILGGDFNRYVVYAIRLLQIVSSIVAERKTQEVVVTETWTGLVTQTDAFRIGTTVTY